MYIQRFFKNVQLIMLLMAVHAQFWIWTAQINFEISAYFAVNEIYCTFVQFLMATLLKITHSWVYQKCMFWLYNFSTCSGKKVHVSFRFYPVFQLLSTNKNLYPSPESKQFCWNRYPLITWTSYNLIRQFRIALEVSDV